MPIHFEEVTGEIERPERSESEPQRTPMPVTEDVFDLRLERALRLMAERAARLAAD